MSDSDNDVDIDERDDVDPESHLRLVKAINILDKTQHILKPSRDGQSDTKSEFHVSKRKTARSAVAVTDIIKILQGSAEHADTGQKLKTAQKNNKTLRKPLEKHEAAVIKRSTGFEEVKTKLGRWDAVVSRNRTLEHQRFPLENTSIKQPVTKDYLAKFTLKSELENELDELKPVEEEKAEETFPMTMNELLEHRKEAAQLRAKQSYKEAKARRQSKIKSKKFHRIQRKEKIKQQLKDFEGLQKTDPEEALRKLEQLEKTRAQERVTLRHKSTGQWAKNKLVRAKYDKETRQELAEQLAISRELTQKTQLDESESEEEAEEVPTLVEDANNPWLSRVVTPSNNEVADFVSGYKKYWDSRNAARSIDREASEEGEEDQVAPNISQEVLSVSNIIEDLKKTKAEGIKLTPKSKKRKLQQIIAKSTAEWDVEPIIPNKEKVNDETEILTVDSIFDDLEYKLQTTVSSKLNLLKSDANTPKNKKPRKKQKMSEGNGMPISEFKKKIIRPEIDEELNETPDITHSAEKYLHKTSDLNNFMIPIGISNPNKAENLNKIDPDKFVAIKPRHLQTALPDMDMEGDHLDDEDNLKRITIAEAFEDDDIVAEFQQDKDSDIKKNLPQIEDLSMPGWGSWVGKGMKPKRRKRFIFNPPKVLPRKDDKKDNVIINESKDSRIKVHQVSELPFPFTSVSDFESTIRSPIGNTFIPETAHRKLIKPAVIVKTGIIIEPMDESQLVEFKKGTNTLRLITGSKYSSKKNKGKNHSKNKNILRMKNGKSTIPVKLK